MSNELSTNIDGNVLIASSSDSPSTDRPEYVVAWQGTEYEALARVMEDRVDVSEFGDIDGKVADEPALHAACVKWLETELLG